MKILYISPENTVGTLNLWKHIHEKNGHNCRFVTFFPSPKKYGDDICLNLPFDFTKKRLANWRHQFYKIYRGKTGYYTEKEGYPPVWTPEGKIDKLFFIMKDATWKMKVEKAIDNFDLLNFDVYHFESGMDFFKDSSFAQKIKKQGKKIICHYHGEDLRTRGVMPELDAVSDLNLTSEVDLLGKHPNINYLFLPFDTDSFTTKQKLNNPVRVCHAPTNRYYKGSATIIAICKKLVSNGIIVFDLIENLPHQEALNRKLEGDIFIDQIGDKGGWGYGMNSVESLSMGICTLTMLNETYQNFIPDHPYVNVDETNLENKLLFLINNPEQININGNKGKEWVVQKHHYTNVGEKLYEYYQKDGIIN